MRIPKILQPIVRKINKALNEWNKYGVKNNDVRYAESLLASFHESENKKLKRDDRINARMSLDEDAMLEYIDIIETIGNMDIFLPDYLEEKYQDKDWDWQEIIRKFELAKGKNDIQTLQEYIDFIDDKNTYIKENVIASILTYYQYDTLVAQKTKNGKMTQDELDEKILEEYRKSGIKKEALYEFALDNI